MFHEHYGRMLRISITRTRRDFGSNFGYLLDNLFPELKFTSNHQLFDGNIIRMSANEYI